MMKRQLVQRIFASLLLLLPFGVLKLDGTLVDVIGTGTGLIWRAPVELTPDRAAPHELKVQAKVE